MKRSIILGVLILVGLFIFTGCGNNSVFNEFKVKDVSFVFDKEKQFGNINYKNAEGLVPDESRQAVYLQYENKDIYDGRFVFRISMAYSNETTLEKFIGDREITDKKINGIIWKTVLIEATSNGKETKSLNYVTEKDGTIYAVSIASFKEANIDITKLAEVFMKGVTIK